MSVTFTPTQSTKIIHYNGSEIFAIVGDTVGLSSDMALAILSPELIEPYRKFLKRHNQNRLKKTTKKLKKKN